MECGVRLRFLYGYHPHAVRDFFVKYQDRILFGTDNSMADAKLLENAAGLRQFKDQAALFYSRHFEEFRNRSPRPHRALRILPRMDAADRRQAAAGRAREVLSCQCGAIDARPCAADQRPYSRPRLISPAVSMSVGLMG